MEFFAILTLEIPGDSRVTNTATIATDGGVTRQDIFNLMRREIIADHGKRYRDASVAFFSAEANLIHR